ncbi:hypothetical protein [Novipirellula artificiosorum]|uniref:hypothetical protein n=1 Tax=Novipirellula artificiosorum TaxID=2528016 RepID=UPI0011B799F1|nr:hypothetical protein [Novipirellula artificiosorum]
MRSVVFEFVGDLLAYLQTVGVMGLVDRYILWCRQVALIGGGFAPMELGSSWQTLHDAARLESRRATIAFNRSLFNRSGTLPPVPKYISSGV